MKISDVLAEVSDRREIGEDASIMDAIDVMKLAKSACLLVRDREGAGVGILSERDIIKAFAAEGDNARTTYVGDYMTTKIVAAKEDDPVDAVIDLMTDKNVRHIPVVRGNGNIAGFLSIMELLAARKRRTA